MQVSSVILDTGGSRERGVTSLNVAYVLWCQYTYATLSEVDSFHLHLKPLAFWLTLLAVAFFEPFRCTIYPSDNFCSRDSRKPRQGFSSGGANLWRVDVASPVTPRAARAWRLMYRPTARTPYLEVEMEASTKTIFALTQRPATNRNCCVHVGFLSRNKIYRLVCIAFVISIY